ncbi:TetR/AcrR family transcriptional regulator [Sphingomonas oligoaromativorans]|uniref:TetR/AcrR family transcriptional regulator n=1 Tax=Sphingomonas oligoaromativorans TaxID=575322 RepID=UPI00141EED23|nr:TetR/AcrR family transcriptional regulator [Sphingomonas oligoaromativorans]NIJ34124.1 TetR/AcrR family transcriptional repressor of nem operon [Sphingomonas oligoaromativorans]
MTEARTDTREAILRSARTTVETHGYTALSFRDLASEVGVKSASVHYHFPTKPDLAQALLDRRCADQEAFFEDLFSQTQNYETLIKGYIAMFRSGFDDGNRMCVAGVMSAEISGLPDPVRAAIRRFKDLNVAWISKMLRIKHPRMGAEPLGQRAFAIYAAVEGAQLIAHGLGGDAAAFDEVIAGFEASGLFSR